MKTCVLLLMTLTAAAIQCPAQSTYVQYSWSTIAGTYDVSLNGGYANGTNGSALFSMPTGLAVDRAGNLYVADTCNHVIRKMTPVGKDWVVSLLAGSPGNPGTADGTGSTAQFAWPMGVAVDGSSNVFVADTYNNTIRKVTSAGVVTTIAGTPWNLNTRGTNYADGPGTVALFYAPQGLAIDSARNLYVADGNYCIRKITPAANTWQVTTLAGDPQWLDKPPGVYQGNDDGQGPNATFGEFNVPETGVAVDGAGNVYVADEGNGTIRKVTPQGVVTTIAGNVAAMWYAINQGNLPWGNKDAAGQYGQASSPSALATSPNAAAIIAAMPNSQFYGPWGLAVDGLGNIYVADTENSEIRKITPQGGVTTLGGATTFDAFGLPLSFPQDGAGRAARFGTPTGVAVDVNGNVYVADNGNFGYFLSGTTTTGPGIIHKGVAPVVQEVALEVTQVIQDWSNSIPLIQGKDTYVRAHLQLAPIASGPVTVSGALLYGSRLGGAPLPNSPISPINDGGSVTVLTKNAADPAVRGQFINSLNFRLPPNWLSGTIVLQVAWSCGLEPTNVLPNDGTVLVTFVPASVPHVKFFAVNWTDAGGALHLVGMEVDDLRRRVLSCYPVADVAATFGTLPWPDKNLPDTEDVNTKLSSQRFWDVARGYLSLHPIGNTIYHGAIPADELDGLAVSPLPSFVSSGNVLGYYGDGRQTAPHELGHNLGLQHDVNLALFGIQTDKNGRQHAKGACKELGPVTYTYTLFQPSAGYSLGAPTLGLMTAGNNSLIYGLDSLTLQSTTMEPVVSPTGLTGAAGDPTCYFDLMSYCRQDGPEERWPSSATYTNLLSSINATFDPLPAVTQPGPQPLGGGGGGDYLIVRGTVDFNAGTAQFLPFLPLTTTNTPPAPPMDTNFLLQALDGSGTVLQTVAFGLEPSIVEENSTNQTAAFIVPVQADPAIQTVQLWYNGAMVARVTASPHAPTLTLTTPNGGQNFSTGTVAVAWSGNDADGDPLTYTVQYSTDNGATWDTLAVDWPGQTLGVDSAELAATTNGLMRVIASDGFNTTTTQSVATFTVQPHPPTVVVNSPRDGSIFMSDQQLFLDATARDMQDGLLGGTNVQWHSDRDGALGSGAMLTFNAKQLSEGRHTITVTAIDSSALTNSAVTHLLELHYPPPQLSLLFTPATNQLGRNYPASATLSWPRYYTNYMLQSSAELAANWATVTNPPPLVSGYEQSVTVGISNASSFFRLFLKP